MVKGVNDKDDVGVLFVGHFLLQNWEMNHEQFIYMITYFFACTTVQFGTIILSLSKIYILLDIVMVPCLSYEPVHICYNYKWHGFETKRENKNSVEL